MVYCSDPCICSSFIFSVHGSFLLLLIFFPVLLSLLMPSPTSALGFLPSFLNPYKDTSFSLPPSVLLTSFEITQQQLFFFPVYFAGTVLYYLSQLLQMPTTGCTGYIRTACVMILCQCFFHLKYSAAEMVL